MIVAVIGYGKQGKRRAEALLKTPGVTGVTCFDTDPDRLREAPDTVNIAGSLNYAISQSDACCICTPSSLHVDQAINCLDHGKNILVEKPLAILAEDAWSILNLAEDNQLAVHVGLNMRYREPVLFALTRLNEIGPIRSIKGYIGHGQFKNNSDDPRCQNSGGPLLDLGTHCLDLCLLIVNQGGAQRASNLKQSFKSDTNGFVSLTIDNMECSVEASYLYDGVGVKTCITILGHDGQMVIHMAPDNDWVEISKGKSLIGWRKVFSYPDNCWNLDCDAFVNTCRGGPSNARDAARLVLLLA